MHREAERLVRDHIPRVRALARRFHFAPDPAFGYEDLVSAGLEALAGCAERFDDERGGGPDRCDDHFWAFAYVRVRGAMQDAIRQWFHFNRRNPGLTPETPISLDLLRSCIDTDGAGDALQESIGREDPPCMIDTWAALRRLPAREREALVCFAFGEPLTEIGRRLGVSESRVCQIKAEGRARMREMEEGRRQ